LFLVPASFFFVLVEQKPLKTAKKDSGDVTKEDQEFKQKQKEVTLLSLDFSCFLCFSVAHDL
jgi:hypothetical protein